MRKKGTSGCELEKRVKGKGGVEKGRGGDGGRALPKGTMMIHYFLGSCKLFVKKLFGVSLPTLLSVI